MALAEIHDGMEPMLLAVQDMKFAPYQRVQKKETVDEMARNWDSFAAGAITCNVRSNGDIYCIDGGHRVKAALQAGRTHLRALVAFDLEYEREAELFLELNMTRQVTLLAKFNARSQAKDAEALEVLEAIKSCGFDMILESYYTGSNVNTIRSVGSMMRVYHWGGADGIVLLLTSLKALWPNERASRNGDFLQALYQFLTLHAELGYEKIIERLMTVPFSAIQRSARARAAKEDAKGAWRYYLALVDEINKNHGGRKVQRIQFLNASYEERELVRTIRKDWMSASGSTSVTAFAEKYRMPRQTMLDILFMETWKSVIVPGYKVTRARAKVATER